MRLARGFQRFAGEVSCPVGAQLVFRPVHDSAGRAAAGRRHPILDLGDRLLDEAHRSGRIETEGEFRVALRDRR